MDKDSKKLILASILCLLVVLGVFNGIYLKNREISNTIGTLQNVVQEELKIIDEDVMVEDVTENEEISSDENTIDVATIEDEENLEIEEIEKEETERF